MQQCILPLFYWGPVQYFTKLVGREQIWLEQFETYPKQTYRNRCEIYGPNGKQALQVPVEKGSFHKTLFCDLKIAYDTAWQKNHFKSIEAAYRSSPFYEYYIDDVIPAYRKKPKFLLDLNLAIFEQALEWLNLDLEWSLTNDFQLNFDGDDYRNTMHPKAAKNQIDSAFSPASYIQGFEQRHGFIPNLSILDLVFNTGPDALSLIKSGISH
ncbi:MAG: WbqC family protein [Salinivirgaceae bacterium]